MRSDQGIRDDQRRLPVVSELAALAALAMSLVLASPASAQNQGLVRVVGHAEIEVVPDVVVVRIGVSNKALTPTDSLDANSSVARKLIDFARAFGVAERDIRTDAVTLQPVTRAVRDQYGTIHQEPDGYAANNTVRVRLTDISRLGAFMRAALDQGATNINGVQFGVADPDKPAAEARRKAVEDAVSQAGQFADAAKIKLGKIVEIAHPPQADVRFAQDRALPGATLHAASVPVPIESGALRISSEVEITWTIE